MDQNNQMKELQARIRHRLPPLDFADLKRTSLGSTECDDHCIRTIQLNSLFWKCCKAEMSMEKVVTLAFCEFCVLTKEESVLSPAPVIEASNAIPAL